MAQAIERRRAGAEVVDRQPDPAQAQPDQLSQVSLVMQRQSVNLGEAEVLVSCEGRLIGEYPLEFVAR